MDQKQPRNLRLYILAGLFLAVMAVFLGVLYDTQVNDYETYYASSVRSIARSETVEAARGNITDRNGKVLVSSRSSYNLTFDASLLEKDEDANESLLRLLQLCQSRGISWADYLPITRTSPFSYQLDSLGSTDKGRFLTYLKSLDEAADALGDYLLAHPSLLETVDEDGDRSNPADDILEDERLDTDRKKADALLEKLTSDQLTDTLLTRSGLSATRLIALMQEDFGLSAAFSGRTRPAPPGKPGGPTPIPETDSPDTGIRLAPERPGAEPFCSAHPAARFSLARCLRRSVPVHRHLSEAPGPCARIRRKRKAPPPSVSEGGGVSVCGFFIARACRGSLFPR